MNQGTTRRVFVKRTASTVIAAAIASHILQAGDKDWHKDVKCSGVLDPCMHGTMFVADNNPYCRQAQDGTVTHDCELFKNHDCANWYARKEEKENVGEASIEITAPNGNKITEYRWCVW